MWEAHNWSRVDCLALGFVTAFPVLVGLVILLRAVVAPSQGLGDAAFCILCLAHPLMIFILTLFYVPALHNNPRIAEARWLWLGGFLVAGIVTLPSYWYIHVWRAPYLPDDATGAMARAPT